MCAVCGQRIVLPSEDREVAEKTYKLTCNHLYPHYIYSLLPVKFLHLKPIIVHINH